MPLILALVLSPAAPPAPLVLPIPTLTRTFDLEPLLERLDVAPSVCLSGRVTFTGSGALPVGGSGDWRAARLEGEARVPELGVNDILLKNVVCRLDLRDGALALTALTAEAAGGAVSGRIDAGLFPARDVRADLRVAGIDLNFVGTRFNVRPLDALIGRAAGSLKMTWLVSGGKPELASIDGTLEGESVALGRLRARESRIRLLTAADGLRYRASARLLGGTVKVRGVYPTAASLAAGVEPGDGIAEAFGLRLERVWEALGWDRPAANLFGDASGRLVFRHDGPSRRASGEGELTVSAIRWRDRVLASNVGMAVSLNDRELALSHLALGLGAGGDLAARIPLDDWKRGRLALRLYRVPLERLAAPFVPGVLLNGSELPADVTLETTVGPRMAGSATVSVARGRLFRLTVGDVRMPVNWELEPLRQRGHVRAERLEGTVAGGRVTGRGEWDFAVGGTGRLNAALRFVNVNGNAIVRLFSDSGPVAGGRASGRVDVGSDAFREWRDLTGSASVSFERLYLFQAPVFRELGRLLGPNGTPRTLVERGAARASLNRGFVRISRVSAAGPTVSLFLDGVLTLDGQVRLGLTANSGSAELRSAIGPLAWATLPLAANPMTAAVAIQLSKAVARHSIQAEITGTIAAPVVTPRPLATLTEEAIRFFLDTGTTLR